MLFLGSIVKEVGSSDLIVLVESIIETLVLLGHYPAGRAHECQISTIYQMIISKRCKLRPQWFSAVALGFIIGRITNYHVKFHAAHCASQCVFCHICAHQSMSVNHVVPAHHVAFNSQHRAAYLI